MPEKISKSQNLPQKISKSQKGLQGNSSGGSQKNLKNLKKSESASKNLKKISKSQSGYQLRYLFATQLLVICPGWVAVAVPFCNTAVNHMPRVGCSCGTFLQHTCQSYAQGGLQMRCLFAMQQHVRISECCLICDSLKCLWFIAICHHIDL